MEGKHTVYRMSAAELGEKDEWIACIRYVDCMQIVPNETPKITHYLLPLCNAGKVSAIIHSMICWRRVKRKLRSRGIGQNLEIQEAELERPRNELIDENS